MVIIHKIKLKPGASRADFEAWVRATDYPACERLPSVSSFSVCRVEADVDPRADYVEVIAVTNLEAFARDMDGALFQSLVARFSEMAEVVAETVGDLIEPGYPAPAATADT